jgi:hypothetical protein
MGYIEIPAEHVRARRIELLEHWERQGGGEALIQLMRSFLVELRGAMRDPLP